MHLLINKKICTFIPIQDMFVFKSVIIQVYLPTTSHYLSLLKCQISNYNFLTASLKNYPIKTQNVIQSYYYPLEISYISVTTTSLSAHWMSRLTQYNQPICLIVSKYEKIIRYWSYDLIEETISSCISNWKKLKSKEFGFFSFAAKEDYLS